jgi:hypothetical protein
VDNQSTNTFGGDTGVDADYRSPEEEAKLRELVIQAREYVAEINNALELEDDEEAYDKDEMVNFIVDEIGVSEEAAHDIINHYSC